MRNKRLVGVVAVLSAAVLALTGCAGSDANAGSENGSGGGLRVGVNHWVANTQIKAGDEKNFFMDEGFTSTELVPLGPSPTVTAALQSGQIDFGVIPTVDYLTALTKNLKLTAVAPLIGYPSDAAQWEKYDGFDLFVRPEANIKRLRDLEGKKIPVGSRQGMYEMALSYLIKQDGGDPSKVDWIQMVAAPSIEAYKAGRLDVMTLAMPYSAEAKKAGAEVLTRFTAPLQDGAPSLLWVAGPKLSEDPEKLAAVQRALIRTNDSLNADPEGTLAAAANEISIPVDLMNARPESLYFPTTYDKAELESLAQKLTDMGFLKSTPDIAGSFAALPDAK